MVKNISYHGVGFFRKQSLMFKETSLTLLLIITILPYHSLANEALNPSPKERTQDFQIYEKMPIIDYLYYDQASSYSPFSMEQSLSFSKSFYNISHLLINIGAKKNKFNPFLTQMSYLLFDLFLMPHPLIWLHEEWHRASMANRNIKSKNESKFFHSQEKNGVVKVSQVSDQDLIRFKAKYPEEFVRMHAAGLESQIQLNRHIEKDLVSISQPDWNSSLMFINALNNVLYFDTCASKLGDNSSKKLDETESSIEERDFTGLDCVAWVYDLFRPKEAYEDRGIHPSGNGIDRYRYYQDLNDDEKSYLKLSRNLHMLNLLSPLLWTRSPFKLDKFAFHLGIHHLPSSFGQAVAFDVYSTWKEHNFSSSVYVFMNKNSFSLGLDTHLYDLKWMQFSLNPRIFFWLQPKNSQFATSNLQPGILMSLLIKKDLTHHSKWFVEAGYKTTGWVPGLVSLRPQGFTKFGIFLYI